VGGELLLQSHNPFLVTRLEQFVDQGGGGDEADGQTLLTGRQAEPDGDVRLAGAAVAQGDDILPAFHVRRAGEIQHQGLVERGQRLVVEAVEAFDRREPGRLDTALDHAPLPVDQFQFRQALQIPGVVDTLCGALACQLVVLSQEGRQPERLQMMGKQDLRRLRAHDAPRVSRPM